MKTILIVLAFIQFLCRGEEVIRFDFISGAESWAQSTPTITYTAWFQQKVYQCAFVISASSTAYSCTPTLIGCDPSSDFSEVKMLIDNSGSDDGVGVASIKITTDSRYFATQGVCLDAAARSALSSGAYYNDPLYVDSNGCLDTICVDYETEDCGPGKQVIYFDSSQPDTTIQGPRWADGTSVGGSVTDCCNVRGLGLSAKPHRCQCQSGCGAESVDTYCKSMQFVSNALGTTAEGDASLCSQSGGSCCCSCPVCKDYASL